MAEQKIIAAVGATGAQGGGLVRAITSDPNGGFVARAITRDVNSDKAKAVAKLGAEVVAASIDDVATLEGRLQRSPRSFLRHTLLGAFFSRTGTGASDGDGSGG